MYTDNLDNYKSYPPTKSCYLDGRYFNKVFDKYPGLIREPLNITIMRDQETGQIRYTDQMKQTLINNQYPGLLRVVINTPESRHSNLVIIDYQGAKLYRYEPNGTSSPYYNEINRIIEQYMVMYIDFDMYNIDAPAMNQKNPACIEKGIKNGFCVAYVIKYGYDYLNGRQYDPSDILRFSSIIEHVYGPLPHENVDIEYGFLTGGSGFSGRNVLIGALGGAAIGGLITGSATGALIGGLGGGLIGGII